MAEEEAAAGAGGSSSSSGKPVMVVGIDDSDHSYYALNWTLQHFFVAGQPQQYQLVVLTAKPPASSVIGIAGVGSAELLPKVETDLKRSVARVMDKAKKLCTETEVVRNHIYACFAKIIKIKMHDRGCR